jgi:hypothetical protein
MRFAVLLVLALTLPANAQQQGSSITLSCNGTGKFTTAADQKPEPIPNLGIIANATNRTVTIMHYVIPITRLPSASKTLAEAGG